MMQKAVNVETKASPRSSAMIQNSNAYYLRRYCFSHTIFLKVQIQGFSTKKSKPKKSRPKDLKPANIIASAMPCPNFIKLEKTSY